MSHLVLSAAIAVSLVTSSSAFADDGQLVSIEARTVFAPVGFDDNDETQVVLDGYLPSGCYRLATPEVTVDRAAKVVSVKPMARYFDVPCIEALIPYYQEVKLGVLSEGRYEVKINDGAVTESLPVTEARSAGPDDFLYAPVDSAHVARQQAQYVATLRGRFTDSCMRIKEVRVENTGKTINVLPIMEVVGDDCRAGEFPFEERVTLPNDMAAARHLLHVRSLNGQAVNHVFIKAPW